jgi:hypothetical protein
MCLKDGIYHAPNVPQGWYLHAPNVLVSVLSVYVFMYSVIVPVFFFLGMSGFVVKFIFLFN